MSYCVSVSLYPVMFDQTSKCKWRVETVFVVVSDWGVACEWEGLLSTHGTERAKETKTRIKKNIYIWTLVLAIEAFGTFVLKQIRMNSISASPTFYSLWQWFIGSWIGFPFVSGSGCSGGGFSPGMCVHWWVCKLYSVNVEHYICRKSKEENVLSDSVTMLMQPKGNIYSSTSFSTFSVDFHTG